MKKLLLLIILAAATGAWVGINFINDRPLFSNPFEESNVSDKAGELIDDSREAIGDTLREAADEITKKK